VRITENKLRSLVRSYLLSEVGPGVGMVKDMAPRGGGSK